MHIKTFLVLLPLLFDSVSSLTIPLAEEPCRESEIQSKWGNSPVKCDQNYEIEDQVKPIKSEKRNANFGIRPQYYHSLNARKPGKKDTKKNSAKGPKKTSKPTEEKNTPAVSQPKDEQSKPEAEGPLTRGRKKAQDADEKPATEENKSQGQPSGAQPEPQPGNSAVKEEEKQKEEARQPQPENKTLTHRPKEDPKPSDTKLHVAAAIFEHVKEQRIFGFAERFNMDGVLEILRKNAPERKFPENFSGETDPSEILPRYKAEQLLRDLGRPGWVSLEESVLANIADVRDS